jgi:hypothetical protein
MGMGHFGRLLAAVSPLAMMSGLETSQALAQTTAYKTETIVAKGQPAKPQPGSALRAGATFAPDIAPYVDAKNVAEFYRTAQAAPAPASKPADKKAEGEDDGKIVTKVKKRPTSPNANVNLIYALIDQGILTEEKGMELIKQAEDEAYVAREAVKTAKEKSETAEEAANKAVEQVPAKGSRRVAYVPDIVKEQIREDVRKEVMAKAQTEGWAAPNALPEWTKRIRVYGDVRARYDGTFFPDGNATFVENQVDYYAINRGAPDNINAGPFPPFFNFDEDRNRVRLRARLGVEANLLDNWFAGIRLASGSDTSPVSTNQTLGGNGTNFSKYDIWIDRAFLNYSNAGDFKVLFGRFDNPFYNTELVWDSDVGFDGLAFQIKKNLSEDHLSSFLSFGAFPIYNTGFNFPSTQPSKNLNEDRWLYGTQGGVKAKLSETTKFDLGVGFFHFNNVQGELSEPCANDLAVTVCNTDNDRPLFGQKGNTIRLLRNADPSGLTAAPIPNLQYYGLASEFDELTVTGKLTISYFSPFQIIVDGEYVKNLSFDKDAIAKVAVNNFNGRETGPNGELIREGEYAGGDVGWLARLTIGYPDVKERGDWSIGVAYKYLESDAVLDAFADSDFGLGGTNLQGYIVSGKVGLARNVWAEARWMSADEIAGPPLAVDIITVDLNAKF